MNTPFEKRVCFTICLCQITAVLSCVSIVYLTVAVYYPSYNILTSDYLEDPVMCTTVANVTPTDCDSDAEAGGGGGWNSCSEWCLSKSQSNCPRIMVDVRHNGSNIRLEECERGETTWCQGIDPNKKADECYLGHCAGLDGLYNCTSSQNVAGVGSSSDYGSRCRELSSILKCNYTKTQPAVSCTSQYTLQNCLKMDGLYDCRSGECSKILPPYNCHKICIGIKTGNKSVIIRQGDVILSVHCQRAVDINSGKEIWPLGRVSSRFPGIPPLLLMFCTNYWVSNDNMTYTLSDCFNGTTMESDYFGDETNITHLVDSHVGAVEAGEGRQSNLLTSNLVGPTELDLRIYNFTRLYINYESCVNTLLLKECEKFYAEYGEDGMRFKSQSRFQCYYSNNSRIFATLRFSRTRTLMELLIATVVPITLAIVSCLTLVFCSRVVHVGDDSRFYFQCCGDETAKAVQKERIEAMAL